MHARDTVVVVSVVRSSSVVTITLFKENVYCLNYSKYCIQSVRSNSRIFSDKEMASK